MTARLMARLGMGTFQITEEGVNRYHVNDGEGAEGAIPCGSCHMIDIIVSII